VSYDLVRSVRNLIQQGVGDASRLGYILNRLENGKYLYLSDQKYLEDLLSESDIITSQPLETKVDSHSLGKLESDLKQLNTQLEKILKSRDTVEKTPSDSDFRNIVTPKMTEYKNRKQQAPANEIPQYQQIINSLRAELAEYKNRKQQAPANEIPQYQQIINSLRVELAEYKNRKQQAPANEIPQYQQIINSLRAELAEYKSVVNAIRPEIIQCEEAINSLKAELADYKRMLDSIRPEIIQYQKAINLLRAELTEYKNDMELMISEKNQRNSIDSQGVKMTEYKNKFSFVPQGVRKEDDMSSLRAEISRLKRNLDSMIL